jgi:thiol-disulfide isomerase/thioredoxin
MRILLVILTLLGNNIHSQIPQKGDNLSSMNLFILDDNSNLLQKKPLKELSGKPIIIEFWATWCGNCISKMQHLKNLKAKLYNDLEVIAISDESVEKIIDFQKKQKFPFLFVQDSGSVINKKMEVGAYPFTIFLDNQSNIQAINATDALTPEIIAKIAKGEKPKVQTSYFLKCPILENKLQYYASFNKCNNKFDFKFIKDEMEGEFMGRRLYFQNQTLKDIYHFLKNKSKTLTSGSSIEDENPTDLFCFDYVVPFNQSNNRFSLALKELQQQFPDKFLVQEHRQNVLSLEVIDKTKLPELNNPNVKSNYSTSIEEIVRQINQQKIFLLPLYDKTGISERLTMSTENFNTVGNINQIFSRIGLRLKEELIKSNEVILKNQID